MDNNPKKLKLIQNLKDLVDSDGWKHIVAVNKENINEWIKQITLEEIKEINEFRALQLKISLTEKMIKLPEVLIKEITDADVIPPIFDPYD